MELIILIIALSEPLQSAPENPVCKEVWETLWEYQQYTELTDKQIRRIAGNCVSWAEGEDSLNKGNTVQYDATIARSLEL